MIPDWLTRIPDLPIRALCDLAIQLKLAWNYRLGEITFADEIWDNVYVFDCIRIKEKNRVAQARLLFPESAFHIEKNFPKPDFRPMRQRRSARIRIDGRSMADNQERAVVGSHRGNVQQPALSASRMGPIQN